MRKTNGLEDNLKGEGLFITGDSLSYIWDISSRLLRDEGLVVDTADIITLRMQTDQVRSKASADRYQVRTDINVQTGIKSRQISRKG